MKWSWKIARIAGIEVRAHVTFVVFLAWAALAEFLARGDVAAALNGVGFLLALFGVVVLHELGHALVARRFGVATRDITLLPIGGVARLERLPENPRHELLIALAGPAVNVLLAGAILLFASPRGPAAAVSAADPMTAPFWSRLLWVNVSLAAFNLLPAFPMDGGRALRALLAMRIDHVRATELAARLGQGIAILLAAVGLLFFQNPLLAFVALFVWMGASQEASAAQLRFALEGIPVRRAMIEDLRTLAPGDPLRRAVEHILGGFQQDFPVVEDGRVVGVLTRADLMRALSAHGPEAAVEQAMAREFRTADPGEMLDAAFARLQECGCHTLPVLDRGKLVGVVTMDNVGEYVRIQSALRERMRGAA
ncbi:MAG TPA: site-2 protease family protein [Planctomycetota bacterium]|jgi:Zn-dependent protease|nr:site-2 protease family protein [Planctomycetota bacterium]